MLQVSVWRGAASGGYRTYEVPRQESQSVLDVVTYIQRSIDPILFAGIVAPIRGAAGRPARHDTPTITLVRSQRLLWAAPNHFYASGDALTCRRIEKNTYQFYDMYDICELVLLESARAGQLH